MSGTSAGYLVQDEEGKFFHSGDVGQAGLHEAPAEGSRWSQENYGMSMKLPEPRVWLRSLRQ